jgi:hypothetical protein
MRGESAGESPSVMGIFVKCKNGQPGVISIPILIIVVCILIILSDTQPFNASQSYRSTSAMLKLVDFLRLLSY